MRRFYADREEGFVWCGDCVPAEVALLAAEREKPGGRKRNLSRYAILRGIFIVGSVSVALRCRVCGAVRPLERP